MPMPSEVRIVIEPAEAGKMELFLYDPLSCRLSRTGMKVERQNVGWHVRRMKEQLEKAGNVVSVKEM